MEDKFEECLICFTLSGGLISEFIYENECYHDESYNPRYEVYYIGKTIKQAFDAYECDFETTFDDRTGWKDCSLFDTRRERYVCAERIGRDFRFTWS